MSKVFFIKHNFLSKLERALQKLDLASLKGKRVAIKLHMGEYGNLNYIRPPIAGKIVEVLKKAGAEPFLIDSTTLYRAKRFTPKGYLDTARRNGFTEETVGCPIVISNEPVQKEGKLFQVGVIKEIAEADALLVLTHCKGHMFSGLGGAIKNLGMGAVDSKTKKVCHSKGFPLIDLQKCIGCGGCEKSCDFGAISIKEGKAQVNYSACWGCLKCMKACPEKAISPKECLPDHALASSALSVLECFDKKDLLFVNILTDISAKCDCASNAPFASVQNIGFLVSQDILAIENASVDLILKQSPGFFDKLGYRGPKQQIDWLEKQGYGRPDYELEEV